MAYASEFDPRDYPNLSVDDFYINIVYPEVDKEFKKARTKFKTENPIEHFERFALYRKHHDMENYHLNKQPRYGESARAAKKRIENAIKIQDVIGLTAANYAFKKALRYNRNDTPEERFEKFQGFAVSKFRDILLSEMTFEVPDACDLREKNFYKELDKLYKSYDKWIMKEINDQRKEARDVWFARASHVYEQHRDYLMTPRRNYKLGDYESQGSVNSRVELYIKTLGRIEYLAENSYEDEAQKEIAKEKARAFQRRKEAEQDELEEKLKELERFEKKENDDRFTIFGVFLIIAATAFIYMAYRIYLGGAGYYSFDEYKPESGFSIWWTFITTIITGTAVYVTLKVPFVQKKLETYMAYKVFMYILTFIISIFAVLYNFIENGVSVEKGDN